MVELHAFQIKRNSLSLTFMLLEVSDRTKVDRQVLLFLKKKQQKTVNLNASKNFISLLTFHMRDKTDTKNLTRYLKPELTEHDQSTKQSTARVMTCDIVES